MIGTNKHKLNKADIESNTQGNIKLKSRLRFSIHKVASTNAATLLITEIIRH